MDFYKFLPKTNCKKCAAKTCMAFALELLKGTVKIEDCPLMLEPKYKKNYEALKEMLGADEGKKKELHIEIDDDACDGCGICVTICPVNARYCYSTLSGKAPDFPPDKHQLFQIKNGKCELLNLDHCRRLEAEGRERECRVCETYCPREALEIVYV
ncbi:MAG: (Fe-S)-binding protein [Promethearchaeota archaeon]